MVKSLPQKSFRKTVSTAPAPVAPQPTLQETKSETPASPLKQQPSLDPLLSREEYRLLNLNFKIFSEYLQTYKISTDSTMKEVTKISTALNENSSLEKKIWLDLIRHLQEADRKRKEQADKTMPFGQPVLAKTEDSTNTT